MAGRSRANAAAATPTTRNGSTVVSCSVACSRSAAPMTITSRTNAPPVTKAARSSFASTVRLIRAAPALRTVLLGPQVRQDGEHTTVVLDGVDLEAELGEDVGDVLLDGLLGHEQLTRYPTIGPALGHQAQHVQLPLRQRRHDGPVVAAGPFHQASGQYRLDHDLAVDNAVQCVAEGVDAADLLLEAVSDRLRADLQDAHEVVGLGVVRQKQQAESGVRGAEPFRGGQ